MKTTANVHLIPTNKQISIGEFIIASYDEEATIDNVNMLGKLNCGIKNTEATIKQTMYYMYITLPQSDLEISKIRSENWYIVELFNVGDKSTGKHIEQCKSINDIWINSESIETTRHVSNCEKIIATTDSFLDVSKEDKSFKDWKLFPSIPQSFIEYYITEYNKGNVIKTIEVELDCDHSQMPAKVIDVLKLNNNEIVISEEKVMSKRIYQISDFSKQSSFSILPHPMCNACRFKNRTDTTNEEQISLTPKLKSILRAAFDDSCKYLNFNDFLKEHNLK